MKGGRKRWEEKRPYRNYAEDPRKKDSGFTGFVYNRGRAGDRSKYTRDRRDEGCARPEAKPARVEKER